MDSALYASMHVLDVDECNMPRVCDNVSMSDDPHDCDAMLHESLGVVDIPNVKLFMKNAKKFKKNLMLGISTTPKDSCNIASQS